MISSPESSPESRPSISDPSSSIQVPVEGLDQKTASNSRHNFEGLNEKSVSTTVKDCRPLLGESESDSLGSSSNFKGCDSESSVNVLHSGEVASMVTCNVSPYFS